MILIFFHSSRLQLARGTFSAQEISFLEPSPRALCDDVVHRRLLYVAL